MSDPDTRMAMPRRATVRPTKMPRTDLTLFEAETDDCPQVLLRVLGLFSRNLATPVTIMATRTQLGINIAIELDLTSNAAIERIAYDVAEIPTVRHVKLAGRRIG